MKQTKISRRNALGGTVALGAGITTMAALKGSAEAATSQDMASGAGHHRFKLGAFEVTTIADGAVHVEGPHPIFGENVAPEDVQQLAEANFLPADKMVIGFTPVIVNTGNEVVLFDSGNGVGRRPDAGKLASLLEPMGFAPDQIDIVVLTHFHPDHIGGLMEDDQPLFSQARYIAHKAEYDFWSAEDKLSGATERVAKLTQSNVVPLADKMSFIKDGDTVVSGIDAIEAAGHTPGHTAFHLESEGQRLMITADTANHYVASLQRPEWHVRFDMDKEQAIASRKKIFDMIAADRIPFTGYHMPFPSVGYVEKTDQGYRYVAETYQLDL